jgi:heme exporter protein CcmD
MAQGRAGAMSDFLAMGGYGAYVWPCFALAAAVLAWNALAARRLHARAREQAIRRAAQGGGR